MISRSYQCRQFFWCRMRLVEVQDTSLSVKESVGNMGSPWDKTVRYRHYVLYWTKPDKTDISLSRIKYLRKVTKIETSRKARKLAYRKCVCGPLSEWRLGNGE